MRIIKKIIDNYPSITFTHVLIIDTKTNLLQNDIENIVNQITTSSLKDKSLFFLEVNGQEVECKIIHDEKWENLMYSHHYNTIYKQLKFNDNVQF